MSANNKSNFILQDIAIVFLSIVMAIILVRTDILTNILTSTKELKLLGSFIAGLFFTSIFTTAPAIVTLGEIAQTNSILLVALFGAAGAVIGDLIIFKFIKDKFSEDLMELIQHQGIGKRVKALFRLKLFRWLTFLIGGLIIASPLPDEIGIALLGFSKMKISLFIPLSFTFNFLGILVIGLIANSFI